MEIKDYYEHEHNPSVFIMFTREGECMWCYSGNELRRIYFEDPSNYISTPIEMSIPDDLDKKLTEMYDNY